MPEPKNSKEEIESSLGETHERLISMKDMLDEIEIDDISIGQAVGLLTKLRDGLLEHIDKADDQVAEALSTLEDADIVDNAQDHTEHVFRALKHLGVQDLNAFTDVAMKMALEQTENL
jgi:hypothetical protein